MSPVALFRASFAVLVVSSGTLGTDSSDDIPELASPFYVWVPTQTKERFLEMCASEGVSIHEMLSRWARTRANISAAGMPSSDWQTDPKPDVSDPAPDVTDNSTSVVAGEAHRSDVAIEAVPTRRTDTSNAYPDDVGSNRFRLELSAAHLKQLRSAAGKGRQRVMLTWTTGGQKYLDLALNLALSVRANVPKLEKRFFVVALDRGAYRAVKARGFRAILHEAPDDEPGLKDAIWKMRWLTLCTLAGLGIDGLVVDSDIVVLRDPFQEMHFDADLETMTDHFRPAEHLWQYWVRPEENINTGFIFLRASRRVLRFLTAFLEEHNEPELAGLPRHWMDQQVFNKFVARRMFQSGADAVHGLYEDRIFRDTFVRETVADPVRIRILDPVVVAHGMNFFWLRAHEVAGAKREPVIAHANGVDGKEYFLRDRSQWYLDDFDRRHDGSRFVTYKHPKGLSLADDFAHLAAGLLLAKALGLTLVLPNSMNCGNCPALRAYGSAMVRKRTCTFDYFAWSQSFLGQFGELVVESGIVRDPKFKRLKQRVLLAGSETDVDLRGIVQAKSNGRETLGQLLPRGVRVLHVTSILEARDVVLDAGFYATDVFECKFHDWPIGWMACRDQRFVAFHGEFARCEPSTGQAGCGYRGITCCEAFWGWAEKLEYFTGRPWDLPCNCGLSACEMEGSAVDERSVCCHHRNNQSARRCDRRVATPAAPHVNTPEDTHTYTSTALVELGEQRIGPQAFWSSCLLNRRLRFGDASRQESASQCHWLASRYLLLRQSLQVLASWLRFAYALLRPYGLPLPPASGDLDALEAPKAVHDLEQLRYLQAKGLQSTDPTGLPIAALIERHARLLGDVSAGISVFPSALDVVGRALHMPSCIAGPEPVVSPSALTGLRMALVRKAAVTIDSVLHHDALDVLSRWLVSATVWNTVWLQGLVLESSLLDGLFCDVLLELAAELARALAAPDDGQFALTHAWAWKFDPSLRKEWVPRMPSADVFVCVWLSAAARSEREGGLSLPGASVGFRHNRMVAWLSGAEPTWRIGPWPDEFELRRVDVVFAFARSLGRREMPGLTAELAGSS